MEAVIAAVVGFIGLVVLVITRRVKGEAFEPNPTLPGPDAPEPRPDEEYPEPSPPPEDDVEDPDAEEPDEDAPEVDPEPVEPEPAPEPEPEPEPKPKPKPSKVFTAKEKDAFFKAIGLPYGTVAKRKASTGKFQRAFALGPALDVDSDFGELTTTAARLCIANDYRISDNFHLYEFRCKGQDSKYGGKYCKDCKIIDVRRDIVIGLQKLRDNLYKGPLSITTGYRCPGYNAYVGGIKGSAHTTGLAADIPRKFSWTKFTGKGWHGIGKSRVDRKSVVHVDKAPWLSHDHVFQE